MTRLQRLVDVSTFERLVVASRLLSVPPPVRIYGDNMLVSLGWRCRDGRRRGHDAGQESVGIEKLGARYRQAVGY
jgi:hypothetical protein